MSRDYLDGPDRATHCDRFRCNDHAGLIVWKKLYILIHEAFFLDGLQRRRDDPDLGCRISTSGRQWRRRRLLGGLARRQGRKSGGGSTQGDPWRDRAEANRDPRWPAEAIVRDRTALGEVAEVNRRAIHTRQARWKPFLVLDPDSVCQYGATCCANDCFQSADRKNRLAHHLSGTWRR